MATTRIVTKARPPRKPRPRPDVDVAAVAAEISAQFPKTLEYLGR